MSIDLRQYQINIINDARALMAAGHRSMLIQAPTGSGKTMLTAHMLKTAAEKNFSSWFLVHRRELVKQSVRTFDAVGVRHGVIANGFFEDNRPLVQICSVQSLARRLHKVRPPKLIIWDECHHVAAGSWSKIFKSFPDAFHIGLTATPERLDGTGLGTWFKHMIKGPSVSSLIDNGYLSKYKMFAPTRTSLAGVHTRMGDYVKSELSSLMDKPSITGDAIREYQKRCAGKRAVVFCVSVEHSKHVVSQFNAAGIPAQHVDGESDPLERDGAIRNFESGRTLILSNVELFGEGFDLPAIESSILLRPTQSLGLYLQQVGRALRPSPGKEFATILDHAGNCDRHGLPDDEREWSLMGRGDRNKNKASEPSIKVCTSCFAAQLPGSTICKFCGTAFESRPREVEHVAGDLEEIDLAKRKLDRRKEQQGAKSLDDLVAIAKARKYKRPYLWAKHVFNYRQSKKLAAK
jgi:DNA repair protein RadD